MIRLTSLLLTLLIATPAAAAAPQTDIKAAFGNTVLTIDPDGRSRKLWLHPDGTWSGLSRRGLDLAGKWTAEGDKVCLSQSKPRLPGHMCQRFPVALGSEIQTKDPFGKRVRVKLVRGHVSR